MKRNTVLLTDQVRKNLMGKCTTAIITEAFINALPFNKNDVAYEFENFAKYANNVISTMHPETLIDRALESSKSNLDATRYLKSLKDAVESVVEPATRRIIDENANSDKSTSEIIAETKLNDKDTQQFINASKQSGNSAVANLVKKKVIDTIKEEKDSYEEAAKIRKDIKQIIKDEGSDLKTKLEDSPKETLESYFDLVLSPTDVRDHISVFSKMQDICIEAFSHTSEKYNEIPFKTIEKITLESTFSYFDLSSRSINDALESMMIVTESINDDTPESEIEEKKHKIAKTAFICTICIMTLLETLKTMHLAKPSINDVKNFVEKNTNINDIKNIKLAELDDKVDNVIDETKKSIAMGATYNILELNSAKEALSKVKHVLEEFNVSDSDVEDKNRIIEKISSTITTIDSVNDDKKVTLPTDHGFFTTRLKNENISNLEHMINLIGNKPIVREIIINVNSNIDCTNNTDINLEITGLGINSQPVATSMIRMHVSPEFGNCIAEIIKDTFNYGKIGDKPVYIYFIDKGYKVPLN